MPSAPRPAALIAVLIACATGLLHAVSSLYWALGGRWLLPTVGAWAVEAADDAPLTTGLALGAIGVVKALAAIVPVAVVLGTIPGRRFWRCRRFWRTVCWVGGAVLVVYGGLNVVVSGSVLVGIVRPEGGYDSAAMIGHALLWDPLFFVWGAALLVALRLSSPGRVGLPR